MHTDLSLSDERMGLAPLALILARSFAIDIQKGKWKTNFKIETQLNLKKNSKSILNIKKEIQVWNVNYKEKSHIAIWYTDWRIMKILQSFVMCNV